MPHDRIGVEIAIENVGDAGIGQHPPSKLAIVGRERDDVGDDLGEPERLGWVTQGIDDAVVPALLTVWVRT